MVTSLSNPVRHEGVETDLEDLAQAGKLVRTHFTDTWSGGKRDTKGFAYFADVKVEGSTSSGFRVTRGVFNKLAAMGVPVHIAWGWKDGRGPTGNRPDSVLEEMLGKTVYQMWREGKVSVSR